MSNGCMDEWIDSNPRLFQGKTVIDLKDMPDFGFEELAEVKIFLGRLKDRLNARRHKPDWRGHGVYGWLLRNLQCQLADQIMANIRNVEVAMSAPISDLSHRLETMKKSRDAQITDLKALCPHSINFPNIQGVVCSYCNEPIPVKSEQLRVG